MDSLNRAWHKKNNGHNLLLFSAKNQIEEKICSIDIVDGNSSMKAHISKSTFTFSSQMSAARHI